MISWNLKSDSLITFDKIFMEKNICENWLSKILLFCYNSNTERCMKKLLTNYIHPNSYCFKHRLKWKILVFLVLLYFWISVCLPLTLEEGCLRLSSWNIFLYSTLYPFPHFCNLNCYCTSMYGLYEEWRPENNFVIFWLYPPEGH